LFDVCFAVLDVETTGASPASAALTEIAAAKYRGGECLGEFQSLVDPGCGVPPLISLLTGITDDMVVEAPPVSSVLPSLLEFVHGAVIVGHNVRFDLSFLDAALDANGYQPLANTTIDTLALARRLVRPDVPNCKLRTLAAALRLEHLPSHRALDDVRATADLLHRLIESATGYGVFVLGDLVDLMAKPCLEAQSVSEVG
jgi:DNA polymerase-3 subunit epsilon